MTTQDFTTTILVNKTPIDAYNAVNNAREWWSEEITGHTDKINEIFNYRYEDVHSCKIRVIELVPGKKIVWHILENNFNFTEDKTEWVDTKAVFDISQQGDKTQLTLTHIGLVPEYECYDACRQGWTHYIQNSLKSLIDTGKGEPNRTGNPQTEAEKQLTSANFTASITVDHTPDEVFKAINNVRGWWQGEIIGNSELLNDEFSYRMNDIHYSKQRVIELVPDKKIVWLVTDSNLSAFKDKSEWTGTKIIFEISEVNNQTQLRFTHNGLVPQFECYGDCSWAWGQLIQESLFSFITTGKGVNVFG